MNFYCEGSNPSGFLEFFICWYKTLLFLQLKILLKIRSVCVTWRWSITVFNCENNRRIDRLARSSEENAWDVFNAHWKCAAAADATPRGMNIWIYFNTENTMRLVLSRELMDKLVLRITLTWLQNNTFSIYPSCLGSVINSESIPCKGNDGLNGMCTNI